jgi:hypothetical protein
MALPSSTSQRAPMEMDSGKTMQIKLRTMRLREHELKVLPNLIVDLEFLKENGYNLK